MVIPLATTPGGASTPASPVIKACSRQTKSAQPKSPSFAATIHLTPATQNIHMQGTDPQVRIKQELVNSITHGFGILFGIVCIPILIAMAAKSENTPGIVGAAIYGFCFLMVFTFSTLYHGFQHAQAKEVLQVLDHISIYFSLQERIRPFCSFI